MAHDSRDPRSTWTTRGELSALAMTLALCVIVPLLLGMWIGGKYGREQLGAILGLSLGVVAAFREMYRTVQRLNRSSSGTPRGEDGPRRDTDEDERPK